MRKTKSGTLGSLVFLIAILACAFTNASAQTSRNDNAEFPLANTKWELVELDSKPVQDGSYLSLKEPAQLSDRFIGSFAASDWCNDYTGGYEASDHSLHMHMATSTLMACAAAPIPKNNNAPATPQVNQRRSFIQVLSHTSAFKIHAGVLELLN